MKERSTRRWFVGRLAPRRLTTRISSRATKIDWPLPACRFLLHILVCSNNLLSLSGEIERAKERSKATPYSEYQRGQFPRKRVGWRKRFLPKLKAIPCQTRNRNEKKSSERQKANPSLPSFDIAILRGKWKNPSEILFDSQVHVERSLWALRGQAGETSSIET